MSQDPKSHWTELRDGCAAVRELAIVTTIVVLIVAPRSFHEILDRAGITSVVGIEFDVDAIEEVNRETHDAAKELDYVKTQLAKIEREISYQADLQDSRGMRQLADSLHTLERS